MAANPTAAATPSAIPPATMTAVASATPAPAATPSPVTDAREPGGFPLAPSMKTDRVGGPVGSRAVVAGAGATVRETSERLQVSDDPVVANEDGWDCRTHLQYEGRPAVDWYVQPGTPVYSTMDGQATLFLNTTPNAFDYYGVSREPYLGDPDRARAPVVPFPGPGGGMGLYVSITNDRYRIDLGHLSLGATGYSRTTDYRASFAVPRGVSSATIIATWPVRRGDVVGYTGDTGYSEAPHLQYAITRRTDGAALCPTREAGFADGGWLFR